MVYLLQNENSEHQVLYCDHSKTMAGSTSNTNLFRNEFRTCFSLEFSDNKAIWGSRSTWYFIVRTFDCTAETLSTNYPEYFL